MACLLVTYDLNEETTRPKIVDAIGDLSDDWARLSESSYAVATSKSPKAVYEELLPLLDGNDNLYVINLRQPYNGQGPQDVNDWLAQNLPQ